LEAQILELRMIAAHNPRYNIRSKFPHHQHWIQLTSEPFPRLSIVSRPKPDRVHLGPFRKKSDAEAAALAVVNTFLLRQCKTRLCPNKSIPACALAQLGRCQAPCQSQVTPERYQQSAAAAAVALCSDIREVLQAASPRLQMLASQERYEEAHAIVERLEIFTRSVLKHQQLASLIACEEIVAAFHTGTAWEIHVIRAGRLAATALEKDDDSVPTSAAQAVSYADSSGAHTTALSEETQLIARWLERPGVRLLSISGDWFWPIHAGVKSLAESLIGTQ
ncbi:MAG: endonuclease, partial [Propionibacteriaceae bacterium]|nr:endonuclease [Propionibacteriaceae bacterium]